MITSRPQRSTSAPASLRTMSDFEQKQYKEALAKAKMKRKNELAGKPRSGVPVPPPVRSVRDMTAEEKEALRQRKLMRDEVLKKRGEEGILKRIRAEMGGSSITGITTVF